MVLYLELVSGLTNLYSFLIRFLLVVKQIIMLKFLSFSNKKGHFSMGTKLKIFLTFFNINQAILEKSLSTIFMTLFQMVLPSFSFEFY